MEEVLLCNSSLWTKQWKKGISFVIKEVDEDGKFSSKHVIRHFYDRAHLIVDEISQQVFALKVLAISVGKGHESLIYIYEKYNSVN